MVKASLYSLNSSVKTACVLTNAHVASREAVVHVHQECGSPWLFVMPRL